MNNKAMRLLLSRVMLVLPLTVVMLLNSDFNLFLYVVLESLFSLF